MLYLDIGCKQVEYWGINTSYTCVMRPLNSKEIWIMFYFVELKLPLVCSLQLIGPEFIGPYLN